MSARERRTLAILEREFGVPNEFARLHAVASVAKRWSDHERDVWGELVDLGMIEDRLEEILAGVRTDLGMVPAVDA